MHEIQKDLLEASKKYNLAEISLRRAADVTGRPDASPQKIKHHLQQLQKKGLLHIDKSTGEMERSGTDPQVVEGALDGADKLFSLPVIGMADCGGADVFADENLEGVLRVSPKLIDGRSSPDGLYAIKTTGASMNRAEINGKKLEDGDYAIVDKNIRDPEPGSVVLIMIDNRATIKRLNEDKENNQIVLKADSSYDYEPIYLDPGSNFSVSGEVVGVVKK